MFCSVISVAWFQRSSETPLEEHHAADVRIDQAIAVHRIDDRSCLAGKRRFVGFVPRGFEAQPTAERNPFIEAAGQRRVTRGPDVVVPNRTDVQRHAQRVVHRTVRVLVVTGQQRQHRQAGCVAGRPAIESRRAGFEIETRRRRGVPARSVKVGLVELPQRRDASGRLVPHRDEQVVIAAVGIPGRRRCGAVVAFDRRVVRNRRGTRVALGGVGTRHDRHQRLRTGHDVDRNAVHAVAAVGGARRKVHVQRTRPEQADQMIRVGVDRVRADVATELTPQRTGREHVIAAKVRGLVARRRGARTAEIDRVRRRVEKPRQMTRARANGRCFIASRSSPVCAYRTHPHRRPQSLRLRRRVRRFRSVPAGVRAAVLRPRRPQALLDVRDRARNQPRDRRGAEVGEVNEVGEVCGSRRHFGRGIDDVDAGVRRRTHAARRRRGARGRESRPRRVPDRSAATRRAADDRGLSTERGDQCRSTSDA